MTGDLPRRERLGRISLDPASRLLVVAPHPDDEVLSFGGALYEHVLAGGQATVIAVTDGEGADNCANDASRQQLAARRALERAAALRCLGAADVQLIRLRFPDGRVAEREDTVVVALRPILVGAAEAGGSPTVVSPWRLDLHPDHEATGRATARAACGLRLRLLEVPIWASYAARHGGPRAACTGQVPIGAAARLAKREAMRCFCSQLEALPHDQGPVLPPDFLDVFDRPFEAVLG